MLTAPNDEIKTFARAALEHVKEQRERALALSDAVFNAVRYTTSSSDVQSPAATARSAAFLAVASSRQFPDWKLFVEKVLFPASGAYSR